MLTCSVIASSRFTRAAPTCLNRRQLSRRIFPILDSNGYKTLSTSLSRRQDSFLSLPIATDESGALKSESADYRTRMKNVVGNYRKILSDFANQYLEKGNAKDIDIVAGAT